MPLISKCSNCGRPEGIHSGIKNGVYYEQLCSRCVGVLGSAEFSRNYDRQWQRRHYAKDLVQPTEAGYLKAYGADKARERGWTEEDIRRHG